MNLPRWRASASFIKEDNNHLKSVDIEELVVILPWTLFGSLTWNEVCGKQFCDATLALLDIIALKDFEGACPLARSEKENFMGYNFTTSIDLV